MGNLIINRGSKSIELFETDPTMTHMIKVIMAAAKEDKDSTMTEVGAIAYTEFLLKNGFEFDDWEDLNPTEIEFYKELRRSYELGLLN